MKLRIAYLSPLPPARTGIADYSGELLPHLAKWVDLTLFSQRPQAVAPALREQFTILPLEAYPEQRRQSDLTLYQMGNSRHHDAVYRLFLAYPGLVVLHDFVLHHFIQNRTAAAGDHGAYARALGYELGPAGFKAAAAIRYGRIEPPWYSVPLNRPVLDRALGLIVHSRFVKEKIAQQRPDRPVVVVPALISHYPADSLRHQLRWPEEAVIFAGAGQITRNKQIDLALRAFARLRRRFPNVYYLLIGEPVPAELDLPALLAELELEEAVHCTGYVPELGQFAGWMAAADVVVNLRYPTAGETSATALRALAAGRPLIVFNHGWYRELPDDAGLKTAPGDEDALLAAMTQLAQSADLRREMGRQGAAHAIAHHHPSQVAQQYLNAMQLFLDHMMSKLNANQ